MPSHIIKPIREDDFYVMYSTVVDSPTDFGCAAEFDPERVSRADEHGTSALWGDPPAYGWQDATIPVREGVKDATRPDGAFWGHVKRSDLRVFCESVQDDGYFHPPAGLVAWEILVEDEETESTVLDPEP